MFTMPVIHHSAVKTDDGCLGTMHLNAINGSSNTLGFGAICGSDCPAQSGVFGNIFGSSTTDSHIYRPQDNGLTFRDSQKRSSPASSTSEINSSRYAVSERGIPIGQRRRSLDLNAMFANPHPRFKDRSLSVGEIVIGPSSRFDAIYENEVGCELNLDGLNIREVGRRASDSQDVESRDPAPDSCSKSSHASYKKKSRRASDTVLSSKSIKLLEKIKDNMNHKHSRNRTDDGHEDPHAQITSSKSGSLKHNKTRHHTDSAQENQEQSGHHHKERKHTIRASAD